MASSDSVCKGCGGPVDPGTTLCTACADAPAGAPARDDAPTIARPIPSVSIPGFIFRTLIGEGGMGSVWLAEETALGRRVAIKMIAEKYAADPDVKSRFLREARAMATLEHPHVVRIYSYGEAGGTAYLTMEYVDGDDLAVRLRRNGRLGVDETIRFAHQIVEALEAGWEHKIVHRDIKPSNILIDRRGNARVADFGLAKPLSMGDDGSLTQSGYLLGTPQYISPEQAQGKAIDFRSDIYSLGVMLHHLLVGRHPYEASTPVALVAKHLSEPLPRLDEVRAGVPPELAQLVDWMTRKNAEERPSSYREIRERLAAMMGKTPPEPVPTIKAPVARRGRTEAVELGVALFVIAALALVLWLQFGRRDAPAPAEAMVAAPKDTRFALAVAPFYGPDEDSTKEGRVMAAVVERAVEGRLGARNVRIFGIDVTGRPVRDHDAARALGRKLGADAVIWGEAIAYRNETEITPYVTILQAERDRASVEQPAAGMRAAMDAGGVIDEGPVTPVTLETEAPNQIEMRKMSAAGLGDVALFLAGVHALSKLSSPEKALELFRQAPPSPENTRDQAQALVAAGRNEEAVPLLAQLARERPDAETFALLGDLHADAGRLEAAAASWDAAARAGTGWGTTRGFRQGGRLYLKEMFDSPVDQQYSGFATRRTPLESGYLLRVDPASGRVLERLLLPGFVTRFEPADGAVAIRYRDRDGTAERVVRFADGAFVQRPALGSLMLRVRGRNAGSALAVNFLTELNKRREAGERGPFPFAVTRVADPEAPATFEELEAALRAAMDRDPTQPWHRFFLGFALAGEGKRAQANEAWRAMDAASYPATPYYEWATMSSLAEKAGERALADAAFENARAARRRVHPPYATFHIERLMGAPFSRAAVTVRDLERRYLLLQRARELTGDSSEADWTAAAAWAKYFRETGDRTRAERERAILARLLDDPLNINGPMARTDYALAVLLASLGTALVLLLVLVPASFLRARSDAPARPIGSLFARFPRVARVTAGTLIAGAIVLDVAWRLATGRPPLLLVGPVALALLVAWLFWRSSVGLRGVLGSVTVRERIALVSVLAAMLVGGTGMIAVQQIGAIASLPIGMSDGFGRHDLTEDLEKKYREAPHADLAFLVGLSHHYGGRTAEARSFYRKAAAARDVGPWQTALEGGQPPPHATRDQLVRGLLGRSGGTLKAGRLVFEQALSSLEVFLYFALIYVLFTAAVLSVRPLPRDGDPASSSVSVPMRILMLVVPGLFDLRKGSPLRGTANLFLALVWILPVASLATGPVPTPGLISKMWMLDLASSVPLPSTAGEGPLEYAWSALLFAYPQAYLFWGFVGFALVTSIALHLARVPKIIRLGRAVPAGVPAPAA